MMIEVSNVTRRFAGIPAVNDISFAVERGEVVGFLGPNGAGKTTTLRMLCGYLAPSRGEIRIGGTSVSEDSLEARRRIGYMPESCPLYPEMRVDEYLRYRARLKGVPRRACRRRVDEVRELCGLGDAGRRVIGRLSKGYRQRVGLADALVHSPELLILDEPTIGLDPRQIRQVRELIRTLAADHTVLLSTHILPEVEATCGRVLILHHGRIVASDATGHLRDRSARARRIRMEVRAPAEAVRAALSAVPGVREVETEDDGDWRRCRVLCGGPDDLRPRLADAAAREGWPLRELSLDQDSLEDVFVSLTKDEEFSEAAP
jgi:ABC-2 type transport system ATP-binding protein